jgi:beta-phosphoglucomutase
MLKAVIFDFDGVIVDSEPLHYQAFQRVLEPMGLGYSWDEYVVRYMGFDDRDAFHEVFRVHGQPLTEAALLDLIARKAAVFQEVIAGGVAPYPGVVELIQALAGKLPVALCSGALAADIKPILDQLQLAAAFDVMVTADEVEVSKPDPASYILAVQRLQQAFSAHDITPAACVAIEDTPAGIAAAAGAGVQVLAVANSYPAARLTDASLVVDALTQVSLGSLQALVAP